MLFTQGKDRFYERMMQQIPGFHKDKYPAKSESSYKYGFADIDCGYCQEQKPCGHKLCPHIMENLADLMADDAFLAAVNTAEMCLKPQKNTLLMLKESLAGELV